MENETEYADPTAFPQLRLFSYDVYRDETTGKRNKPTRHVKHDKDERLQCGHVPLPTDGKMLQYPLSMRAFLAVVDCPMCQAYLKGVAAARVVRRSVNRG